jgi:hypothetical protein
MIAVKKAEDLESLCSILKENSISYRKSFDTSVRVNYSSSLELGILLSKTKVGFEIFPSSKLEFF